MGMEMQKIVRDEGGKEVGRGERGEGGKATEILSDERGGGELISHYKLREHGGGVRGRASVRRDTELSRLTRFLSSTLSFLHPEMPRR